MDVPVASGGETNSCSLEISGKSDMAALRRVLWLLGTIFTGIALNLLWLFVGIPDRGKEALRRFLVVESLVSFLIGVPLLLTAMALIMGGPLFLGILLI